MAVNPVAVAGAGRSTFVDLLRWRAETCASDQAYVFVDADGTETQRLTYGEVDSKARAVASALQGMRAGGQRVLLLYPPGLDYIVGFVGCLYAGAVAVPVAPPTRKAMTRRVQTIAANARPVAALTVGHWAGAIAEQFREDSELAAVRFLNADCLSDFDQSAWVEPDLTSSSLALLQYTSGSTLAPRGVLVTHGNLLHNQAAIQEAFRQTQESVIVSWLPLYHDMGLIGGVLQPLYVGARGILLSSSSFLQKPVRWLRTISNYRATTSGGPDFAYEFCARQIADADLDGLDLSSWTVAFNGSEQVQASTLDAFVARFEKHGFSRRAFYPCYGLAEATLFVTGGSVDEPPAVVHVDRTDLGRRTVTFVDAAAGGRALVGCGYAAGGQRVDVVDPASETPRASRNVGEIWVSGESVAQGYWENPSETDRVFRARVSGSDRVFLRTGDLGFFHEGELYITGRDKDMFVIRGTNYYPEDIEWTARGSYRGLFGGAAFVVEQGDKDLVVLVQECDDEVAKDAAAVFEAMRAAIVRHQGLLLHAAALTRRGATPRTTSGKIQRSRCRTLYVSDQLPVSAVKVWSEDETTTPGHGEMRAIVLMAPLEERVALVLEHLQQHLADVQNAAPAPIDPDRSVVELGLDSLLAANLVGHIEQAFGVLLDLGTILDNGTMRGIAAAIVARLFEAGESTPAAVPAPSGDRPLSSDQERLWLATRIQPDTSDFNLQVQYRLDGQLDIGALEHGVGEIVRRHSSLRTTFRIVDGQPVQCIAASVYVPLRVIEAPPDAERHSTWLGELVEHERTEAFDLAAGSLLRVALVRCASRQHVLIVTIHHIVADAWSLGVFSRELGGCYRRALTATAAPEPMPAQFVDFVEWQHQQTTAPEQREYWRTQIDGAAPLDLPFDRPRPPLRGRAEQREFHIDHDVDALRALARAEGTTLFAVLLAAFHVLLAHCCDQDDIVFAVPVKNRRHTRFDDVIGFFARPLPVRLRGDRRGSFREILGTCRSALLQALAHGDVSFSPITMLAANAQHTSPRPAMPVTIGMLPPGVDALDLPGVAVSSVGTRAGSGDCDLFVTVREESSRIAGSLVYDSSLFDASTIDHIVDAYRSILQQIARSPELLLSALQLTDWLQQRVDQQRTASRICVASQFTAEPIRASVERWLQALDVPARLEFAPPGQVHQQLLDGDSAFSRNRRGLNVVFVRPSDVGHRDAAHAQVDDLVEAVRAAAARESAPYLVCLCPEESTIDRERLDAFVASLRQIPRVSVLVMSEVLLGFGLDRVADPHAQQLADIPYTEACFACFGTAIVRHFCGVEDIFGTKVIVLDCDQTLWKGVCGEDGPQGIELTDGHRTLHEFMLECHDAGMLLCQCSRNNPDDVHAVFAARPELALRPRHFAGCEVSWRPKSESIRALAETLQLDLASFVFLDDDPVECAEVRAALPQVLTLQLPSAPERIEPFLRSVWAFDRRGATSEARARTRLYHEHASREAIRKRAPTLAEFLAELGLEIGIAPLDDRDLSRIAELTHRTNQFNVRRVGRSESELRELLRGGGLEGIGVRVRDRFGDYGLVGSVLFRQRETAIAVDTFLLSCRALGRGVEHHIVAHLGQLACDRGLTSVDVPLVPTSRNRPASDFLASLDGSSARFASGDMLFRFDAASLAQTRHRHSSTADMPALPPLDGGIKQPPRGAAKSDLAARIATELTTVDAILRFVRPALKARPRLDVPYVAPRNAIERELAAIASELLGIDEVGVDDDFFDLGSHSLTAMQFLARVQARFGVEVPLPLLFDSANIATVAEEVARASREQGDHDQPANTAPRLVPLPRDRLLPLSFAQQRLWFLHELHPESAGYNASLSARVRGALHVDVLTRALQTLIDRHESLRTRFVMVGDGPAQVIEPHVTVSIASHDVSDLPEAEREVVARRLIEEDAQHPFRLSDGPPARATIVRLGPDDHLLLITVHHIAADGWSMRVLIRELSVVYEAYVRGQASPLPPLAVQYADYAGWQRAWLQPSVVAEHLAYWRAQLAGAPQVLPLPTDRPRPPVQRHRGRMIGRPMATGLGASVDALAGRTATTPFMVLLACFELFLFHRTKQRDFIVGSNIANRSQVEAEAMVGFFVNELMLRADLSGDPTFGALLARVRETTLNAYAHQDLPYDMLVAELGPERSLSHSPLHQVVFGIQDSPMPSLALSGLEVTSKYQGSSSTKFDLVVTVVRRGPSLYEVFEFDEDLFEIRTIRRMLEQYEFVVKHVTEDADRRVSELDALMTSDDLQHTRAERERVRTVSGEKLRRIQQLLGH